MTKEEMEKMSREEMESFLEEIKTFDPAMSLEDYAMTVRDAIYIDGLYSHRRDSDWESTNRFVETGQKVIENYYLEKAPVDDAFVDVRYCCG